MSTTPPPERPKSGFWVFVEHPRTALIAAILVAAAGLFSPAVFRYVLLAVAALLALRSLWEWKRFQEHIGFRFQSPIVRKAPRLKSAAPVADLGRVDFEENAQRALKASVKSMNDMTKAMNRYAPKLTRRGNRIEKLVGASVGRRRRSLARTARVIRRFTKRMAALERSYRVEIEAFVENSKRFIETAAPSDDFQSTLVAARSYRETTITNKEGHLAYQNAIRAGRAMGTSQALNAAYDEQIAMYDRIIEDADTPIAYCDWIIDIAAQRGITDA